jgi:hypothetical protein
MPSPKRKSSVRKVVSARVDSDHGAATRRRTQGRPEQNRGATRTRRAQSAAKVVATAGGVTISEVEELEQLRAELERAGGSGPLRWNANPDDVQRSVAQLVLTLVEFIRKLLERQAIRRMEGGTLTDDQIEDIGRALMTLEETIADMARRFGLSPEDLNLDLGPVGKLM